MLAIQRAYAGEERMTEWWLTLEVEPLYDPLRGDPRFQKLLTHARTHARDERVALERLRSEGVVPKR